jgi:hypothetical protein
MQVIGIMCVFMFFIFCVVFSNYDILNLYLINSM